MQQQRCSFQFNCRHGGVIQPDQDAIIVRGRTAHLNCALGTIRRLQTMLETEYLSPTQRRYLERTIALLDYATTNMNLSPSGNIMLDLGTVLAEEQETSAQAQRTVPARSLN